MQENIQQLLGNLQDNRFVPLGEWTQIPVANLTNSLQKKGRETKDKVWGTLGWENDAPFGPSGELVFSREGNSDEGLYNTETKNVLTRKEIADLKAVNPELSIRRRKEVHEYYINFDAVEFSLPEVFNPVELPRLRLTVFIEPDEGAIVYFQRSKKGDFFDENAFSEYILHEQEKKSTRDRLTYLFPVEPKYILEPVPEEEDRYRQSERETGMSFIVKVLVFKQKRGSEKQLYNRFLKTINQSEKGNTKVAGKDKYALLRLDPVNGAFSPITTTNQIDPHAKTVLLIHGTFVDTASSFEHLLKTRSSGKNVLQELLLNRKFEQILAFNHPTISDHAEGNVAWLSAFLQQLDIQLSQPLQIIASSRGALVAECMASDTTLRHSVPVISKIMLFSAGNGCGYFNLGHKISRALAIWGAVSPGPAGKIIASFAQLSVQWFLSQPGCKMMTINSPELNAILSKPPLNPSIRYTSVLADWHKCLVDEKGFFKRVGSTSLDAVIRIALGREHDWVIGVEQQKRIPVNSGIPDQILRYSTHGRYLEAGYVRDASCNVIQDPYQILYDFFD